MEYLKVCRSLITYFDRIEYAIKITKVKTEHITHRAKKTFSCFVMQSFRSSVETIASPSRDSSKWMQLLLGCPSNKKDICLDIYFFGNLLTSSVNFVIIFVPKGQKLPIPIEDIFGKQKSTFWSKIDILVKNRHFGQKSTFWSKIIINKIKRNTLTCKS